jgi:hypothetical protein
MFRGKIKKMAPLYWGPARVGIEQKIVFVLLGRDAASGSFDVAVEKVVIVRVANIYCSHVALDLQVLQLHDFGRDEILCARRSSRQQHQTYDPGNFHGRPLQSQCQSGKPLI